MCKVEGQKISRLWTIGSMYANGYIDALVDIDGKNQLARIHVSTITKMLNEFNFELVKPDKRYKYFHIENPELIEDIY